MDTKQQEDFIEGIRLQLDMGALSLEQAEWNVDNNSDLNTHERSAIKQRLRGLEEQAVKKRATKKGKNQ
jgi:hypothetical protein